MSQAFFERPVLNSPYEYPGRHVSRISVPSSARSRRPKLRSGLKAEIDQEAWESLRRDVSRPFPKPASGRIAVKVINHLGDEVMKVFRV